MNILKEEYNNFTKEVKCAATIESTPGLFIYYILTGMWSSDAIHHVRDTFNKYFDEIIENTEGPGKDLLTRASTGMRASLVELEVLESVAKELNI